MHANLFKLVKVRAVQRDGKKNSGTEQDGWKKKHTQSQKNAIVHWPK